MGGRVGWLTGEDAAWGIPEDETELTLLMAEKLLLCSKEDRSKSVEEKFGTPQLVHSHSTVDKWATS